MKKIQNLFLLSIIMMACTVNAQDNAGLRLPAGFSATLFANNIGSSRHISITKSGIVVKPLLD
jgi:hypothetical protein